MMNRRYLTEAEQKRLLATVKHCAQPLAQRDYHWIRALILTGMRVSEWAALSAEQVRTALTRTGWLVSLPAHCKGGKAANDYVVTGALRAHLQALLDLSDAQAIEYQDLATPAMQPLVWGRVVGDGVAALSVRSYEARLKEWAVRAGLPDEISPHWLRHTRGMNVIRRSRAMNAVNGLLVAQRALNHRSIRSTQVYTKLCREEYEAAVQAVDGGGRVSRRQARAISLGMV